MFVNLFGSFEKKLRGVVRQKAAVVCRCVPIFKVNCAGSRSSCSRALVRVGEGWSWARKLHTGCVLCCVHGSDVTPIARSETSRFQCKTGLRIIVQDEQYKSIFHLHRCSADPLPAPAELRFMPIQHYGFSSFSCLAA